MHDSWLGPQQMFSHLRQSQGIINKSANPLFAIVLLRTLPVFDTEGGGGTLGSPLPPPLGEVFLPPSILILYVSSKSFDPAIQLWSQLFVLFNHKNFP